MTAFFETRTPPLDPESTTGESLVALYFEDDRVALNAYTESRDGDLADGTEVMIDRAQIDALVAALQTMRTMIDARHPQPQLEAPKRKRGGGKVEVDSIVYTSGPGGISLDPTFPAPDHDAIAAAIARLPEALRRKGY